MIDLVDDQRHAPFRERRRQPRNLVARHHRTDGIVRRVDERKHRFAVDRGKQVVGGLAEALVARQPDVTDAETPYACHRLEGRIGRRRQDDVGVRPSGEAKHDRKSLRRAGGHHNPVGIDAEKSADRLAQRLRSLRRRVADDGVVEARATADGKQLADAPFRSRAGREVIGDGRRGKAVLCQPVVEEEWREVHGALSIWTMKRKRSPRLRCKSTDLAAGLVWAKRLRSARPTDRSLRIFLAG